MKELHARFFFLFTNRNQWGNQADSRIPRRTQLSLFLLTSLIKTDDTSGIIGYVRQPCTTARMSSSKFAHNVNVRKTELNPVCNQMSD